MPLTKRDFFRLRVALTKKYGSDADRVAAHVGINLDNVPEGENSAEYWRNILANAVQTSKLESLLVHELTEESDNNENYRLWLTELQTGIPERVQKLAKTIRDGQCVLFLGAGTLLCSAPDPTDRQGNRRIQTTFNQAFAQWLSSLMDDKNIYYDQDKMAKANLAYITQRYSELTNNIPGMQGKLAKDFYETCRPNKTLYEELAKLPWRVVINTNPDAELATILNEQAADEPQNGEQKRPRCVQRYYNMTNNVPGGESAPQPIESLGPGQTLLYNFFGSFDDRPSMVLTESQLLDFTSRILNKNPALDPLVMDEFTVSESNPKSYLFLGFDFDQWYVKIIFQTVLKLVKQKDRSYSIFPLGVDYYQFNRDFFEEEFKCYFIDYELLPFVEDLVKAYRTL